VVNFKIETFDHVRDFPKLIEFCKEASLEKDQPASSNMWTEDWEQESSTLPFILSNTNRYESPFGNFILLTVDDNIVACSGVYRSDFSEQIAIGGVRTWIKKEYRNQHLSREYLLPSHKKWAKDHNYGAIALTFNDYNKNIIKLWNRIRLGEKRSDRQPHHIFYNNLYEVDFPLCIQYTKQWLIFEKLKSDFNFNWESIEFTQN
jgi:hypothetical protein